MKNFFANLFSKALGIGKTLVSFLAPIVAQHGAQLLETALPIAATIVTSLESNGSDSDVKRSLAIAQLKTALLSQGAATEQDLTTSALSWMVETALQKVRATTPAS